MTVPGIPERVRLSKLAKELEPAREPWWVGPGSPGGATPAQGWWWIPRGATAPAFLGHNHIAAHNALEHMTNALLAPR